MMNNNYFTPYPTETDLLETSERHEGSDYTESLPQEGLADFDPAAFQVRLLATRTTGHWTFSIVFCILGKLLLLPLRNAARFRSLAESWFVIYVFSHPFHCLLNHFLLHTHMPEIVLSGIACSTFFGLLTTSQASQMPYGGMTYPSQGYSLVPPGGPGQSSGTTPVGTAYSDYFAREGIEMPESQRTIQKEVSRENY